MTHNSSVIQAQMQCHMKHCIVGFLDKSSEHSMDTTSFVPFSGSEHVHRRHSENETMHYT